MSLKKGPEFPVHYRGVELFRALLKTGEIRPGTILTIEDEIAGDTTFRVHTSGLSQLDGPQDSPKIQPVQQVLAGDKAFFISGFIPEVLNYAQAQEVSKEMVRLHAKHRDVLDLSAS